MIIEPIKHYAITGVPSVYDEDAVTAIELAGRTAAKMNETIAAVEGEINAQNETINDGLAQIPTKIDDAVSEKIADGTFENIIDEYEGNLKERVDNLETSYTPGSTTADAELYDVRVGDDGVTRANAGASVREQLKKVKRGDVEFMTAVNLLDVENGVTDGHFINNGALTVNVDYATSDFIRVKTPVKLWFSRGIRFIEYYDENHNFQTRTTKEVDDVLPETIESISGIKYVRVSWNKNTGAAYLDELAITTGVRRVPYQKHRAVIDPKHLPSCVITGDVPADRLAIMTSDNLFNKRLAITGFYMGLDGWCYDSDDYAYSDMIPVKPGETIHISPNARFITAFDIDKTPVESAGANNYTKYVVPDDIYYIVVTVAVGALDKVMINRGDVALPFQPYRAKIDPKYYDASSSGTGDGGLTPEDAATIEHVKSTITGGVYSVTAELTPENPRVVFDAVPNGAKRGSAYTIFFSYPFPSGSSELKIIFGEGTQSISITQSGITVNAMDMGELMNETTPGATPALIGDCYFTITPLGDKVRFEFFNNEKAGDGVFSFEANYVYESEEMYYTNITVEVVDDGLTQPVSVRCKYVNAYLSRPVWVFGDSYTSFKPERVLNPLDRRGINNYFVAAIPGAKSATMWAELNKALQFNTPKYLLWLTGMNDEDDEYISYVDNVVALCEEKGITPVFALVPSVPEHIHIMKHNYLKSLGVRYINWVDPVGCDANFGDWYGGMNSGGMLSGDGVHPNAAGAEALAWAILEDFPEIIALGGVQ